MYELKIFNSDEGQYTGNIELFNNLQECQQREDEIVKDLPEHCCTVITKILTVNGDTCF